MQMSIRAQMKTRTKLLQRNISAWPRSVFIPSPVFPVYTRKLTHFIISTADGEFDTAGVDKKLISARLKQDVMEHSGKVHLFVADNVSKKQNDTPRDAVIL